MKNIIIAGVLFILFTLGCKEKEVSNPNFEVSTLKQEYKVNDTVTFNFKGNPDIVYYYSDEDGKKYEFRNRTFLPGTVNMSFRSRLTQGSTDPRIQQGTLKVLSSSDFINVEPGFIVDSSAIAGSISKWRDITSRFILPSTPSNTQVNSGSVDITDLVVNDKPLFIAFRYTDTARVSLPQRFWFIDNFSIDNTTIDGIKNNVFLLINRSPIPLFSIVSLKNQNLRWGVGSTSAQININGGNVNNSPDNDDWIITKPLLPFNIVPDKSEVIKGLADNDVERFKKVFKVPGTYKVVFIGKNVDINNSKEVVRELTIRVVN